MHWLHHQHTDNHRRLNSNLGKLDGKLLLLIHVVLLFELTNGQDQNRLRRYQAACGRNSSTDCGSKKGLFWGRGRGFCQGNGDGKEDIARCLVECRDVVFLDLLMALDGDPHLWHFAVYLLWEHCK